MKIAVSPEGDVVLLGLNGMLMEMLHNLPMLMEKSGAAPWAQDPVSGENDDDAEAIREDWKEMIEPELKTWFDGQIATVLSEMEEAEPMSDEEVEEHGMDGMGDTLYRLVLAAESVEKWYGALNQARLAMDARHHFSERMNGVMMEGEWTQDERAAFAHYRMYSAIQEALLHAMEIQLGEDDEDEVGDEDA